MTVNIPRMNPEIKADWLRALRSGEYQQTDGVLHRPGPGGGFCCLGVLCDLAARRRVIPPPTKEAPDAPMHYGAVVRNSTSLPLEVLEWAGIPITLGGHSNTEVMVRLGSDAELPLYLSTLNDNGDSFVKIADVIEETL